MKTISMTISDRIAALSFIDAFKGSSTALLALASDVAKMTLTEADKTEASFIAKTVDAGNGQTVTQYNWDDTKAVKDVELEQTTLDFFKTEIKKKSDANELTMRELNLVKFGEKLNK